jgi:hypothetical protein
MAFVCVTNRSLPARRLSELGKQDVRKLVAAIAARTASRSVLSRAATASAPKRLADGLYGATRVDWPPPQTRGKRHAENTNGQAQTRTHRAAGQRGAEAGPAAG